MIFKLQNLIWSSLLILLTNNVLAEESNVKVSYCGSDNDILSIQELSFEPEFIQPGDDVMIYGSGSLSKDISLGTKIEVVLKYGGTDYYKTTIDYCSFVLEKEIDGDLQCPVHEGALEVAQKVTIPKNIAKGVYTLHLQGKTDEGESIGCADLQATF
ncbi:hypothetical protein [Parasitella parasitica]|uniref:Phosphatidylglycerol/phosphatidylinositol transfer protein n=1 Tax=Parasitella parasitica TaxID=35722 RepID=A0A0B7NVH5_9FUNG|nr:hypothetical protein [Parasitella parasitica]